VSTGYTFETHHTGDLSGGQILALVGLFETVFQKASDEDLFRRKYTNSCSGHGIHSMMLHDGRLVGAFSAIPVPFHFFGRDLAFAIAVDLMIAPEHRGHAGRLRKLAENLYRALTAEGVAFVFSCLRDEMFGVHQAVSRWRAVGPVHYVVAPLALKAPGMAALRLWNQLRATTTDQTEPPIRKVNDLPFRTWRYQMFPSNYRTVALPQGEAVYLIDPFYPIPQIPGRVRVGLLLDVHPCTKSTFDAAVEAIGREEPGLHALAFQGHLSFHPAGMLEVPGKLERQRWTLAGRILNPSDLDDRVFDIANWNLTLANGDLV
jgi:hypothetical protein